MPRGYGYQQQGGYGYDGYGGGYSSRQAGRYAQPNILQYESFFNPIPIEFLQQEFGKRQGKYDQAYAGALAAKDELAQMQVGMQDIADKNTIIKNQFSNIDKMVSETYGGDWGKAAKDIARSVTEVRSNPFWNAQAEAQKQREVAQQLKIKYGQDAFIFNDPTNLSTVDEQGNVRDFSQFQPDIVQKGDYLATARELIGSVSADTLELYDLTPDEIDGFLESGKLEGVTLKKIQDLAKDKDIQKALLDRHGEIRRGFTEGSDQLRQQHGLTDASPEKFAERQLLAAGKQRIFTREDKKHQVHPYDLADYKKSLEGNPPSDEPRTNFSEVVENRYLQKEIVVDQKKFNKDGTLKSLEERKKEKESFGTAASYEPIINSMTPAGVNINLRALFSRIYDAGNKLKSDIDDEWQEVFGINAPDLHPLAVAKNYNEFVIDLGKKANIKREQRKIEKVKEKYPYLEGTDGEIMSLVETANKELSQIAMKTWDYNDDWREAENETFLFDSETGGRGRIFDQQLHVNGEPISGRNKEKLIANALGYNNTSEEFNKAMDKATISDITFTGSSPGAYIVRAVNNKGKTEHIEMSPHAEIQEITTPSWLIANFIKSAGQEEIPSYEVNGQTAQLHEGNLVVPVLKLYDSDDDGKNESQVYYYTENKIVPTSTDNKQGRHATKITPVIYKDGEFIEVGDPMTLADVIEENRKQSESWFKKMRNQEQTSF